MTVARLLPAFVVTCLALLSSQAEAYTVAAGDFTLRPVAGASTNFLRLDVATRETPPSGLLVGVDFDYAVLPELAVAATLRPVFGDAFVDAQAGLGAKYRLVQTEAPLIPYGSLLAVVALGTPLRYGDAHWNVGGRLGLGADYFIVRDVTVGLELGTEASWLVSPVGALELTAELLLGVGWRF
ncbi:MAG: hypothetical protein ACO3JL_09560 [Myxococcota bacterium]